MVDGVVAPDRAFEQRFTERLPHPALRELISCVFVQEISPRALPTGTGRRQAGRSKSPIGLVVLSRSGLAQQVAGTNG